MKLIITTELNFVIDIKKATEHELAKIELYKQSMGLLWDGFSVKYKTGTTDEYFLATILPQTLEYSEVDMNTFLHSLSNFKDKKIDYVSNPLGEGLTLSLYE